MSKWLDAVPEDQRMDSNVSLYTRENQAARLFPLPNEEGQDIITKAFQLFDVFMCRDIVGNFGCSPFALADLSAQRTLRGIYFSRKQTKRNAIQALKILIGVYWTDGGDTTTKVFILLKTEFYKKFGKYFNYKEVYHDKLTRRV